jgi:hypothetical protein
MGWAEDLIPPLDPLARTALGWSRVIEVPPASPLYTTVLSPDEIVNLRLESNGTLWFALQPLINLKGVEGWMVELDYLPQGESWQRVQMSLMGPKEQKEGLFSFSHPLEKVEFQWAFSPTPPRVHLLVQKKGIRTHSEFGCTLSSQPPPSSAESCPMSQMSGIAWIILFLVSGSLILRKRRR